MRLKLLLLFFLISSGISIYAQVKVIEKIEFSGIKKLNKDFLNKILYSKQNEVLDSILIQNDIQALNRLNGVSKTNVKITNSTNPNFVILTYEIIENHTLIPTLSIGTTQTNGTYRVGLYEYNFLGKNITLGGFYQYNDFNSFGICYLAPQYFNKNVGFGINIQRLVSLEPVYLNNNTANYKYSNTAAEIISNYNLNVKNELKFATTIFNENYQNLTNNITLDFPLKVNYTKLLVKFVYNYNNINYNFYQLEGFKSILNLQTVATNFNLNNLFLIGWNDFSYYKNLGSNFNLASRFRLGIADNTLSPFAPFAIDNNINLRGVGNLVGRATGTIVINTEIRKTLFEKKWFVLQGNAFLDCGSFRNAGGKLSDFTNKNNIKAFSGLGLRLIHKTIFNAIFRIDYGVGLTNNAPKGIVFGIGQYF